MVSHHICTVQFCNSYITMYYIAFFKPFAQTQGWRFLGNDFDCVADSEERQDCFEELSLHLLAMFSTQLVIHNISNVVPLYCGRARSQRSRASTPVPSGGLNEQLVRAEEFSDPTTFPRYIQEARLPARKWLCCLCLFLTSKQSSGMYTCTK